MAATVAATVDAAEAAPRRSAPPRAGHPRGDATKTTGQGGAHPFPAHAAPAAPSSSSWQRSRAAQAEPPEQAPDVQRFLWERTRSALSEWRRIGAPGSVLRWLREGVRCEWLDKPPLPFHHGVSRTALGEERRWATAERDRCLGTGAWRKATVFDFVSRAFIVTHKGKRRLVIDLRFVNLHHVHRGCRYESLHVLRRLARRGDWMWSVDLADAYHHLGVHESDQKYFTFALETEYGIEYFQCSALNFGWCMSPWYFTMLMKPVVGYIRSPELAGQRAIHGARRRRRPCTHPPAPPRSHASIGSSSSEPAYQHGTAWPVSDESVWQEEEGAWHEEDGWAAYARRQQQRQQRQHRQQRARAERHRSGRRSSGSGVRCLPWLDDFWFGQSGSYEQACEARDFTHTTLGRLGLQRNPAKGHHDPTQVLPDHLGFCIDSARGLFLLTARRMASLRAAAADLLVHASRHRRLVSTRRLASFAGLAQSSTLAVPIGRFMLRATYDDLSERRGWAGSVRLSQQTLSDLRFWYSIRGDPHVGRSIWLEPTTRVGSVDAGPYGWGGALDWARVLPPAYGFWTPEEAEWHITMRELCAVRLFIQAFLPECRRRRVLLFEDNQAVVFILTNMVTKSPQLMQELRRLWRLLDTEDIELRVLYIRSAENTIADFASRLAAPRDYVVSRWVFERVQEMWGTCTIDAFASAATSMLPRFWTAMPVQSSAGTDAFSQQWAGERVWAHPPPSLLLELWQLLLLPEHTAEVLVCAPYWPSAVWFAPLLELCDEYVTYEAGSLERVAADAPARLSEWPIIIFHIPPLM